MQKRDPATVLKDAGFRATKPRLSLLALLEKSHTPLSIHEIAARLRRGDIDQVTVYRTIEAFARAGIVREVNLQGQRPRYELPDAEHDHHHIVCIKCRKLEDFIGCDIGHVEKKALRQSRSFSRITGHSFDLYGLCNACA
jgi:Fur family ferric uptake transcriptional regulator